MSDQAPMTRRAASELTAILIGGDASEIERGMDRMDEAREAFADDLYAAGFYAVSHDVRAERCTIVWALDHVKARAAPDGPWNEDGQQNAQRVLDRWDWRA